MKYNGVPNGLFSLAYSVPEKAEGEVTYAL
jgi:hypothetical protein